MFAFAMFMSLCGGGRYGDVVCVGRQFYWCMWCWSVRCVLKRVGHSTPPCGTPFLNWLCVDVCL